MSVFRSFWMAGFESATHINRRGARLDLIHATQHDALVDEDYARLAAMGIFTARDGIRWHLVERAGGFEFASLAPMAHAAGRHGIQVLWNLCHYGWPNDLDVLSPAFSDRFARYCRAVAQFLRDETADPAWYTPINELSFLAYAAGEAGIIHPRARGRGGELKRALVRAALAGEAAIRDVDPRARIVYVDPVINVLAPAKHPEWRARAEAYTESQYESWDMLLGRREPELGGHAGAIDAMGINFYHSNQWVHPRGRLRWEDEPRDPRWVPLHRLIERVYRRYELPIFIGETSHFGSGRARWIREIGDEVCAMHRIGVPLAGVCVYPIIDRPDWENPRHWHHSGLWDLVPRADGTLERAINEEYARAFAEVRARVAAECGGRDDSSAEPDRKRA